MTEEKSGGSYFSAPKSLSFISSGCILLDCVLGGGWPLGRVSNIIGDKAVGKTLLAIEASANFYSKYDGKVYYREVESAFDTEYAAALGMPVDRIDFREPQLATVEDFYEDLSTIIKQHQESEEPGLYILDSLDALSDREELERKIDKGTYGQNKAKKMSELFRRLIREVEKTKIHLMVISQTRDNIGVTFGAKYSRSGGNALDFYASHIVYLANIGQIKKSIKNIERTIGIDVKAKCTKNKVGLPFRECEFGLMFGFGVDDVVAMLDWLKGIKQLDIVGMTEEEAKKTARKVDNMSSEEYNGLRQKLAAPVEKLWREIDEGFLPPRRKYGG